MRISNGSLLVRWDGNIRHRSSFYIVTFAFDALYALKGSQSATMTVTELLAKVDHWMRPLLLRILPARWSVAFYSWARQYALQMLCHERIDPVAVPALPIECWGLRFRTPLINAAGMFKHGECYELAYRQGAGGWLAGTTTALPRMGNVRRGIAQPFVPYPRSRAASNWLGLPNPGHRAVAARVAQMERYADFPIGVSVALDPDVELQWALEQLVEGMALYYESGVDFLELNESCPNTGEQQREMDMLVARLSYVTQHFLRHRGRSLPVVVKFSTDTDPALLGKLMPLLANLGFDGITLGNTSTRYEYYRHCIAPQEQHAYAYFTHTFGGGISGEPLRRAVVELVRSASEVARTLERPFHIVGVGGIARGVHLCEVLAAGASLAQWYTGYFERFAEYGHLLYQVVLKELELCTQRHEKNLHE